MKGPFRTGEAATRRRAPVVRRGSSVRARRAGRGHRRAREVAAAVVALVALVALSGCRLDAEVAVAVRADLSGRLTLRLEPDAELAAAAREAEVDLEAQLRDVVAEAPGWELEGDDEAIVVTTGFADPAELERRSAELASGLDAAELSPLAPFTVTATDDAVTLDGVASLVPGPAVEDLGLSVEQATEALADAVDYRVSVTGPGDVRRASGAGDVTGDTAVWSVPAGERTQIQVTAARPTGPPAWLIVVVTVCAAALLAAAVLRIRSRPRP